MGIPAGRGWSNLKKVVTFLHFFPTGFTQKLRQVAGTFKIIEKKTTLLDPPV